MKEYQNFSAEDFLWDDAFRRWVLQPSPQDHARWESWLADNPQKAETVNRARELVKSIGPTPAHLSEADKNRAISTILNHFDEYPETRSAKKQLWFSATFWFRAACICLLTIGFVWFFSKNQNRQADENMFAEAGLRTVANTGDATLRVKLFDGSVVYLSPDSKLSYPDHFSSTKRTVHLSGGAFFEVARQPGRPFYVFAGKLVTKVLGTSFHVRSFDGERNAVVSVKTGRVAVFAREKNLRPGDEVSEQGGVVIEPNQQIVLAHESVKMTKTLVADPELVIAPDEVINFNFNDSPVSDIFKTLQKAYGIDIIFDEKTMKHCPVTATLTDLSLYEQLDLICNAVSASYEVIDGRIVVDGKGCGEM
ncbi:FecR family protein [Dyadobacter crusticola]|uniref:FecR family protein n=1 Tax=Dyadobacter crusticola TaxID=292407 RepID=UPI0004E10915|nr:FecR family protein [Dyadobacter crusticola]